MTIPLQRGAVARELPRSRATLFHTPYNLGVALLLSAVSVLLMGVVNQSLWIVSLATLCATLGFGALDIARARQGGVTPATLYAVGAALTAYANMRGLLSADGPRRSLYFIYTVESKLDLAIWLNLAGAILPILGFYALMRQPLLRIVPDVLPNVSGSVSDRRLVTGALVLAGFAIAVRLVTPLAALGTLGTIFFEIPTFATFALARMGTWRGIPRAGSAALIIALAEIARALYQSYLRVELVTPLFAFALGSIIGARSFAPLRSRLFLPIYVVGALFIVSFGALGHLRTTSAGGVARVKEVYEYQLSADSVAASEQQTIVSRLTSFNQLSQIGRIVEEDGFLEGQTLAYLGFAFIPRFLWPEKPTIAKGPWFALRIGQARVNEQGRITNAVNMTIPGELYLNFGWLGTILGCLAYGAFLGTLWLKTNFWTEPRNVLGSAFGYYLLITGVGLAADLQTIVTLIALYLLFLVAGAGLRRFGRRKRAHSHGGSLAGAREAR
ncbi:MAG: hypothetical protein ACR2G6_11570 [Gemmatimonadaceae bacterium]